MNDFEYCSSILLYTLLSLILENSMNQLEMI